MSEVLHIEDRSEFQDLLDTEVFLVVDFTAPFRCVPCRQFAPHFERAAELAARREDAVGTATFVAVDVDDADWAVDEFGIRGVPTVKVFGVGQYMADLKSRNSLHLLKEIEALYDTGHTY